MKVSELIEELKKMPQDAEIRSECETGDYIGACYFDFDTVYVLGEKEMNQ